MSINDIIPLQKDNALCGGKSLKRDFRRRDADGGRDGDGGALT